MAKCTQICVVCGEARPGAVRSQGTLSVSLGLAALSVNERLLLLLCQGLPLLSVLPAAIQQGQTVLRNVRQGLEKERKRLEGSLLRRLATEGHIRCMSSPAVAFS